MTRNQRDTIKGGDELIITQHGFDRGCKCLVSETHPNGRQIFVRIFTENGSHDRLMSYRSLGFPEKYMTIMDVSALSFHEMWDGRDDYFKPGNSLSESLLLKWLNLGFVNGKRFSSNNAAGHTWGIPVSELPKIRSLFENPPDTKCFPKVTRSSDGFVTWKEYMDSQGESHV